MAVAVTLNECVVAVSETSSKVPVNVAVWFDPPTSVNVKPEMLGIVVVKATSALGTGSDAVQVIFIVSPPLAGLISVGASSLLNVPFQSTLVVLASATAFVVGTVYGVLSGIGPDVPTR